VYYSTIKKIVIVLFLMVLPMAAVAAGLGSLNVTSALGEPLNANIELLSASPAELASLKAKIESHEVYEEQGLARIAIHDDIKVHLAKEAGKNILKLTSSNPVSEPFLDLLVVAEWSNGRIARQYTVLLDPPTYKRDVSQIQAPAGNSFDNSSINKKAIPDLSADANAVAQTTPTSLSQEHLTRRGDTLYHIARRMQPTGVSLDKMLVALFEANPDAFDGKNMNRLKVGKILQAPSEEALNAMTNKNANNEIKLQTADWNRYRNKLAVAVAQKTAQASDEDTQSSSGKIKSAAEDQSAPEGAAKDVVKLSTTDTKANDANMQAKMTALQEEVSAREKGLKEAEDRTIALEKQIADMQKLLTLKNNAMLNAQEEITSIETPEIKTEQDKEKAVSEEEAKPLEEIQEAAKPEAVVKKPVLPAKATTNPEQQSGFLSNLLNTGLSLFKSLNKMILATGAALLALLLAVWFYFRYKDSKKLEDFEQGIVTSGSLKANTVFGDTASGIVATGDTSFLTDFSHSAGAGLIDTHDVDPIAEAEVYMAYGRDAQAEEILKDAISKEPQRYELHLKLLEMYAANKNTSAFETVAGEMYISLGADNSTWAKVAEIGAKLEPNNPLYQVNDTEPVVESAEIQSSEPEQVAEMAIEAEPNKTQLDDTLSPPNELVEVDSIEDQPNEETLITSDFSDSPLAAEADLDFSMIDHADEAAGTGVGDLSVENSNKQVEPALQFNLDALEDNEQASVNEKNETPSLDFPTIELEESAETKTTTAQKAESNPFAEAESIEIPSDLMLEMPKAEEVSTQSVTLGSHDEEPVEDFDFGLNEDSNQEELNAKQVNVLDVSGISLDISDEASFVTEPDEVQPEVKQEANEDAETEEMMASGYEEVETKLELVAAYIDMEDKDGAKELLEEVLKEGNLNQRKRANQILASLA
jgi:pilus assembly protein FimV